MGKPEEERKISPAIVIIPIGLGLGLVVSLAALAWAAPPTPPPGRANLYGKVIDAITGEPIADVLINLDGIQVYSDAGGNYIFTDVEPESYVISFTKGGYIMGSTDVTLVEGNNELNVSLTPIAAPVANLYGVVTDAETGLALAGVKVTIDDQVAYTDSNGAYAFVGLSPSSYTITFEKDGYETEVR